MDYAWEEFDFIKGAGVWLSANSFLQERSQTVRAPLKGGSGRPRGDIYYPAGRMNLPSLFFFGLVGSQFAQFPETCFHARHLVEVAIICFKRDLQLLDCCRVITLA